MRLGGAVVLAVATLVGTAAAATADPPASYSPPYEAQNYSKINERAALYTPAFRTQMAQRTAADNAAFQAELLADPERNPRGQLCYIHLDGCAGDTRLYDWAADGHGISTPVLFTARDGATLSGHVWATKAGPAKRPGVVILNGSVQAPEELYLFAATTLAKAGYVVLTYDPQGQGRSDTLGESPDTQEGVPAQAGVPFFDGPTDALDFFTSTPSHRYAPRLSRGGNSHDAKQKRRVAAGLDSAYNPFWKMLDTRAIGLAGHSFGASGVSYDGQADPRVKAVVAWDNLCAPAACDTTGTLAAPPVPAITKPALGMSADYYLTPEPYTALPDPLGKSAGSLAYTKAGVDTMQVVVRGGTHYEFSFIPDPAFGATRRGMDMVSWYTTAWFDKYLRHVPNADARLLTDRWRRDTGEAAVDPRSDGNVYSAYYRSRLDLHRSGGTKVDCEDLRTGCAQLQPDGLPQPYDYLATALTPDGGNVRSGSATPKPAAPQAVSGTRRATATDAEPARPSSNGGLAFTGGTPAPALIACALFVAGTVIRVSTRRRRTP